MRVSLPLRTGARNARRWYGWYFISVYRSRLTVVANDSVGWP